jgi:hypothetical protein
MAAPPDVVWGLVSDVTRLGGFSPETFEARWTRGSTGPSLGAYFKGHVKRNGVGPVYWTLCRVTECEPGRDYGFVVEVNGEALNHWRYELRPVADGTEVTESFELSPRGFLRLYWAVLGRLRGRTNERGMRQTLERIRTIAETTTTPVNADPAGGVSDDRIAGRAGLLPEERAAGSDDPEAQAAAILQESDERTAHPEQTGAASTQTSTPDERPT